MARMLHIGAPMPKKIQRFCLALLAGSLSLSVIAGPSLPQGGVDLATLDLNGVPFRHFHLSKFRGVVLDYQREASQGFNHPSQATHIDELMRPVSYKLSSQLGAVEPHADARLPAIKQDDLEGMMRNPDTPAW